MNSNGAPPGGSDNGSGGGKGPVRPRTSSLSSSLRPSPSSSQFASSSAPASGRTTSVVGTAPPRPLLSDPIIRSAATPSTPRSTSSQSHRESPHVSPGSASGLPASTNLPKDTPSISASGATAPKRKWFSSEIVSRTSQRVSAPSPQARPNAGASWSNEPQPPIQSERPMPNLVGAGPMRPNPNQRVAPLSLAGEPSARTPVDAGEPYPPISGRPQEGFGASLLDQSPIQPVTLTTT